MNAYLIYIGKGKGSLLGIPARDLKLDEIRKLNVSEKSLVGSGLYRYAEKDTEIILDLLKDQPTKKTRSKNRS
jgi:hypothetical protein